MSGDLCYYCDGTGERDFLSGAPCHECNGTGWREDTEPDYDDDREPERCEKCGKEFEDCGDIGCRYCDRRSPDYGLI